MGLGTAPASGAGEEASRVTGNDREAGTREVAARIGHAFEREDLLLEALTHRSYRNEHPEVARHNERLEFLGDAVLDLLVAAELMERLPGADEGALTRSRAALVNEEALADLARRIDLGSAVLLGRGEEMNNGRDRTSILSDAMEAVIGAVFLDGGLQAARATALSWMGDRIDEVIEGAVPGDAKTDVQRLVQSLGGETPRYRVVEESGPDHEKVFEVEITMGGATLARGLGRSKKEAEKDAARKAMAAVEEKR